MSVMSRDTSLRRPRAARPPPPCGRRKKAGHRSRGMRAIGAWTSRFVEENEEDWLRPLRAIGKLAVATDLSRLPVKKFLRGRPLSNLRIRFDAIVEHPKLREAASQFDEILHARRVAFAYLRFWNIVTTRLYAGAHASQVQFDAL